MLLFRMLFFVEYCVMLGVTETKHCYCPKLQRLMHRDFS